MHLGLIGTKVGMSRAFTDDGKTVPVTVVHAPANRVVQVKTAETDGYLALQVTVGERKPSRLNKPTAGHFKKAGVAPGRMLSEFRITAEELRARGDEIGVGVFREGQRVDVAGVSKGKGYAGVIKRHHFRSQDATHGNSLAHRAPGSIGQCQTPGRVFKGKKMAGHMGASRVTTRNLTVFAIDEERSLLLIKGAIPGAPGGAVEVRSQEPLPPQAAKDETKDEPAAEAAENNEADKSKEAKDEPSPDKQAEEKAAKQSEEEPQDKKADKQAGEQPQDSEQAE